MSLFRDPVIARQMARDAAEGVYIRRVAARLAAPPPPPPRTCCWPHGEPGTSEFKFCGDPDVVPSRPYCDAHCRLAYKRPSA